MDFCLIAAGDFSWLSLEWWGYMLQMAFGLGVVIFVHELGHFLVAKACGVKCEKFYLGFDVPMPKIGPFQLPSKLMHFQYGETEYGIGIIPLGGYVKMLGQDDNPANAEKEAERTRIKKPDGTTTTAPAFDQVPHESITDINMEPQPLAEQLPYEVDPRSYTAKNVPQRMAIISAGVIMNVIFAVIFATIAYRIGVPYTPTFIGGTQPGSPAWVADLPVGARIAQVGRKGEPRSHLRYRQDFQQGVLLHGYKTDLPLLIEPRGGGKPEWVELRPAARDVGMLFGPMAMIGVEPMAKPQIAVDRQVIEGFPAALAETKLLAGDRIVSASVAGKTQTIEIYPELHTFLALHADDEVQLAIERKLNPHTPQEKIETHTIDLARRPLKTLGIAMTMGPITAIQQGSPAATAGLHVGDVLEAVNGQKITDPMLVAEDLRRRAGEEVRLTVLRGEKKQPVEIAIAPRPVRDAQTSVAPDEPVLVDALGITLRVEPKVANVAPDSPAHGQIEAGDIITHFQIVPAGETDEEKFASAKKLAKFGHSTEEVSLTEGTYAEGKHDWPALFSTMQWLPEGTKIKLTFTRNGAKDVLIMAPYDAAGYYFAGRGLAIAPLERIHEAKTWSEAFYLGRRETWESLNLVVTFLKKLVTGQIRLTSLGGPGTIAVAATSEASRGPAALLIFLTMLSANLAVVNFLPIPVLDGGHMMFLAYEGIFRRPVNEKWQIRLSLLGLSFVLCLMVFVIGLDVYRLSGLAQ